MIGCAIGAFFGFTMLPFMVPHGGGTEVNTLAGAIPGMLIGFLAGIIGYLGRRSTAKPRGTVLFQCPSCQKAVTTSDRLRAEGRVTIYKCRACGFEH
jgi:predicted RNA-binding Zn-ribbon protein involved in translation (DUF1610 family)